MPKYRITSPDGKTYDVTAPEGASQADVMAYVQRQHAAAPAAKPLAYQLAEKVGMQNVLGALDGLQHHGLNAVHGLAQLGEHGLNAAASRLLPADSGMRQSIDRATTSDDAGLAQRERDYQARTAGNAGSYVGAAAGEILPWMVGVGEARALGLLPKATSTLGKAGLLAGEGAAIGAATPVTEGGDYATQKAKQVAIGAGTAATLHGVALGAGAVRNAVSPAARVARMFGNDPATIATLRKAGQGGVPGFVPTVAQALQTPEAIQAERILRNHPMTAPAFARADASNGGAIVRQVDQLAGDGAAMQAAKDARTAATQPYYDSLPGQRVDPAGVLQSLDALHQSSAGVVPNVKSAIAGLRNEITSRTGPDGMIDADILSGLHQNAGSHLGPTASAQEKLALGPIKDSIANALDAGVPGFRANNSAWRTLSQPISDMQAGRSLRAAIDGHGPDATGNPTVTLNDLNALLKRDAKARYPMSQQARAQVEAMRDAAKQRAISNNTIAASGPGTGADTLRGMLSSPLGRYLQHTTSLAGGGSLLGGHVGAIAGGLLGAATGAIDLVAQKGVGRLASNARLAADALEAEQLRRQGLLGQLPNYLLPYGAPQFPLLMQQTP
jgi:hypothetical protein